MATSKISVLDDDGIISCGSPEDISKQVIAGERILKKKNTKGSRVWEQFQVVFDPSNDAEVFEVAYCCVCEVKKEVSMEERYLGENYMLDHLK